VSYPNSDLSPWTMLLIAVVMLVSLALWLVLVYRAAREPTVRPARPQTRPQTRPRTEPRTEPKMPEFTEIIPEFREVEPAGHGAT
jgi:hypothetical protein